MTIRECIKCHYEGGPWAILGRDEKDQEIFDTYSGKRRKAFYKVGPGEYVCRDCHYKLRMQ